MRPHLAWHLVGVAAILLPGASACRASVQGRDRVCWLGTGDWQLCEEAGHPHLVASHRPKSGWSAEHNTHRWFVSTPTIRAESGKFLACDPNGRDSSVSLVPRKGDNTRWAFEFVSRLSPGRAENQSRGDNFVEGLSGFTFRVKVAEGPFRDWYLAAGEAAPQPGKREGGGAVRPLKLVRDVKQATVFMYVEENYYVDHK